MPSAPRYDPTNEAAGERPRDRGWCRTCCLLRWSAPTARSAAVGLHLVRHTVVRQLHELLVDLLVDHGTARPVRSRPVEELLANRILGQLGHPTFGQLGEVLYAGHLAFRQQRAVWAEPAVLLARLRVNRWPSDHDTEMRLDDLDVA